MELWTGLVCLVANPDCKNFRRFGEGKGAYVHVAAWAESRSHFEARVKLSAEQLDCILREIEEVGLLESKMKAEAYPEEFLDMRNTASRQPDDVVFGTFHYWLENDVN